MLDPETEISPKKVLLCGEDGAPMETEPSRRAIDGDDSVILVGCFIVDAVISVVTVSEPVIPASPVCCPSQSPVTPVIPEPSPTKAEADT